MPTKLHNKTTKTYKNRKGKNLLFTKKKLKAFNNPKKSR